MALCKPGYLALDRQNLQGNVDWPLSIWSSRPNWYASVSESMGYAMSHCWHKAINCCRSPADAMGSHAADDVIVEASLAPREPQLGIGYTPPP